MQVVFQLWITLLREQVHFEPQSRVAGSWPDFRPTDSNNETN
jgi:hypothetical protein